MDKPLTIPELADLLGVSVSWIQKRCAARAIPHTRVARQVRFTADHVRQILAVGDQPLARITTITRLRRSA